jgi:hypothetical protein
MNLAGIARGSSPCSGRSRGIVITLDIAVALMLFFIAIILAYTYYGEQPSTSLSSQLMGENLQDTATVLSNGGYFSAPLAQGGSTGGILEILDATPASVCMEADAYGLIVPSGLEGYWKFDEGGGTTVSDSSGNGLAGTLQGTGVQFSPDGISGSALQLNGSQGYVSIPSDPRLMPASITIVAWIKPVFNGQTQYVVSKADGYQLFYDSSGTVTFETNSQSGWVPVSSGTLNQGQWNIVVAVYQLGSPNHRELLVDNQGVELSDMMGDSSRNLFYSSTSSPLLIGQQVQGEVDEVRIYDRALNQSEIEQLYSDPQNLLYSVDKQECAYSGGEIRSLSVPFTLNGNQDQNNYYSATLKAWLRGTQ